jgi:radical SAM enzyme (TIGR01210 family)
MSRQYVIPVFIPHLGCPNDCIFCNQKSISGQMKQITEEEVEKTIQEFLHSFKEEKLYTEISFFGGSFTGIDIELQERLLKVAYKYVQKKKVDGIRVSTRPDYINKDELKLLKKYGVKTIELGVQSTNDYILQKAKRGHTFEDVKRASKLIRRYGFTLGHQMMIGLPESTWLDELNTAKDLAKLKPKIVRLYPVLIIKHTELEKEFAKGEYVPITLEQAVERCKELYYFFDKKKINVIRMGLQNTDIISNPENINSEVVAGPYHEAFGQLVEDSIWYDKILSAIKKVNTKVAEVEIEVNPNDVNNIIGHKKENIQKFKELYEVDVKIKQEFSIRPGKFNLNIVKTYKEFLDD